jgi:hypothetical protein
MLDSSNAGNGIRNHDGHTDLLNVSKGQESTTKVAFVPVRYALVHIFS